MVTMLPTGQAIPAVGSKGMSRRKPSSGLESIPGIGPSLAQDLRDLGYRDVADLRDADPREMFARLTALRGRQDPCVLYAFRCAAYYASVEDPEPKLLQWWAWKGRE